MARRKEDGRTAPPKAGGWDPSRMSEEGQITKVVTGGNSKPDQAWILAEAESLARMKVKPADCPWDVELQWDGHVEELDPDWFTPYLRGDRHCTGVAYIRDGRGGYIIDLEGIRLQRPCLAIPMLGSMVCQKHGGQLGHVREAAKVRLTHAAEKAANTLITLTDPRDELNEIVDQKVRVQAANSVLDRVGVKAGVDVEVTVPGYKNVVEKLFAPEEE